MECGESNKYRRKIKGFTLPFNIKEREYRISTEDKSRRYKFKSEKTIDDIKREVQIVKEKRVEEREQRRKEREDKYEKNRQILKRIHNRQLKEREGAGIPIAQNIPSSRRTPERMLGVVGGGGKGAPHNPSHNRPALSYKHLGAATAKSSNKVSLQLLEKLTYNDINQNANEDQFRPQDFLNDSDDEDLSVLRKYKKNEGYQGGRVVGDRGDQRRCI